MFAPDEEQALRQTIESRRSAFATDFDVVRNLTRTGVRAKIELIRYRGGLAVKKTYRQTCLRFMDREAALMDAVSPHRPEILPVLERGANYLIMPFVEGRPLRRLFLGVGIPKLMPLRQVRQVADLLRYMFSRGYDPVDLAPHNLLVDRSGKLTAIDFEFVHRSDGPIEPERSACLNGIPDGFEGDWPLRARWNPKKSKTRIDPYRLRWLGHTGLSRESFLHDPPAIQYVKRMANYPTYLCTKAVEREVQWLRHRTKQMLRNRLPVITRMAARALRSRAIRT
jgi:serine/threonine protein kinase